MRTYQEVIDLLAARRFNKYMSGSDMYFQFDDSTIAFIYDKEVEKVNADVKTKFKQILDAYYVQQGTSS